MSREVEAEFGRTIENSDGDFVKNRIAIRETLKEGEDRDEKKEELHSEAKDFVERKVAEERKRR